MRILVTGATGYVGGRLVPRLLERGHDVRVLVRDRSRIRGRAWATDVDVHEGDLLRPETLAGLCEGVDVAYYLVHSMLGRGDFAARDAQAAANFVEAALAGGVRHTIYLGGLVPKGEIRSRHLRSRAAVGEALREALPATEFRAGPIIGSGSASFEMVRYLTERLPAMIAPKWIRNTVQPVAIRDVLAYLVAAGERDPGEGGLGVVPIGADQLTFAEMMQFYATLRGLRRLIVPVPVLAPKLAARWVGFVTPIPNRLAVPLVQGVIQPLTVRGERAAELFPGIRPIPYRIAVELALGKIERGEVETRWSGALGERESAVELDDWEGLIREVRVRAVQASPDDVFAAFSSLGGERGWLVWRWAWWLRGAVDKLVGGPGLRRGRRHPTELLPGETLDWWRVEAVEPPHLLRLRAEMKVPGRAWLQWEAREEAGRTSLVQTATFEPRGLPGTLYWYGLYPLHRLIFTDMSRAIGKAAEQASDQGDKRSSVQPLPSHR